MGYFDDPKESKRSSKQQRDERGPVRAIQPLTSEPVTSADTKRPSIVNEIVSRNAGPLLLGAALLHPRSPAQYAKIGSLLEKKAPALEKFTSDVGRSATRGFSPTALSSHGIDLRPPDPTTMTKHELGSILPGGSAALGARGAPRLERVNPAKGDAIARETEAILRETGAYGERFKDSFMEMARKHWRTKIPDADLPHFYEAMENHSIKHTNPHVQEVVDDLRQVYKRARKEFENYATLKAKTRANPSEYLNNFMRGFAEEYFPRTVEKYNINNAIHNFMKARTGKYPTIKDLMAGGLNLKYKDPIEATNQYVAAMTRYLAKQKAFAIMEDQGLVRYYSKNNQNIKIPQGWEKIETRIGERGMTQAYAPGPAANLFNRKYNSQGFGNDPLFKSIQHGMNLVKQGAFLGAAYHGVTTAIQASASDVQRAIKLAAGGHPIKALGVAAKAPASFVTTFPKGRKLEKEWLDTSGAAAQIARQFDFRTNQRLSSWTGSKDAMVAHLYEKGGGRAKPYEQAADYRMSNEGSYIEAIRRGTLRAQAAAAMKNIRNNPLGGSFSEVFNQAGRAVETISEPIMRYYVPTIKNGAFYSRMFDWLEVHPNATYKEGVEAARHIVDSIDNRFGEMIHDNIFWSKQLKQVSQLATVSYSYELGTLREIGGGIADVMKGKLSSERASYLLALPIAYGYLATLWGTLAHGQPPESPLDLIAPRSGGIDPRTGKPERLYPFGDMKDVVHLLEDPYALVAGKLGPAAAALYQTLTNSDWKGQPIHPPEPSALQSIEAYFNHLGAALMPIPLTTRYGPKTGFNAIERFVGARPAGINLTDPERSRELRHLREEKAWNQKLRYDKRTEALYAKRQNAGGVD